MFDEEDLGNVALAAQPASACTTAESGFVEKLRSGEAAAFETLIDRYSGEVYGLLFRMTGNAEEAADLTQETFLRAVRGIQKFRGDSELKTWLFRIAVNESRNRFRWWKRRKRDETISLDATAGAAERPVHESIASGTANPEELLLAAERESVLNAALRDLPDIFREAVILCDIEGLSYDEIAKALNANIGTVKSRIARGREELRRRLKDF
jgi:RNA polymerase sigma-70 factor, ECF subfamily